VFLRKAKFRAGQERINWIAHDVLGLDIAMHVRGPQSQTTSDSSRTTGPL
jgi:hypothetical protein